MLFDTHMHTRFSTDSQMILAEAAVKAQELGIGIVITEHMDLDYPQPLAFLFDIEEYFATYGKQRSERLLLGIEIGMRADLVEENRQIIAAYPFDYVIGSIHVVEKIDIYSADFYQERTKQEVYHQYFQSMLQCVESYDFIDSLGHIDYICRYARYDDKEIYYDEFSEIIDQILRPLAAQDKAIEINTRRLDNKASVEVLLPIYKRFAELGGRMATIGSDAHVTKDIGRGLQVGLAIAEQCGLQPVWFANRQPHIMKK